MTLFDEADEHSDPVRRVPESQLKGKLGSLLTRGSAGCGALRAEDFSFLFPGAKIVGSAAIALIQSDGKSLGALAVGSSNANHYDSDMGTLFLEFAAEVIAGLLIRLRSILDDVWCRHPIGEPGTANRRFPGIPAQCAQALRAYRHRLSQRPR